MLDNGTCYHEKTPDNIVGILERARISGNRIRVFYGDTITGRCWMDEFDTIGRVGRSTGDIKIPLLIKNRRSLAGGALLDDCIVKIVSGYSTLYQHHNFNLPDISVVQSHVPGYMYGVDFDYSRQVNFPTKAQAERYVSFMKGDRLCK